MFRKFSEWAVAYAIRLGYIKEEEQEEYTYGLDLVMSVIASDLTMLIIGIIMKMIPQVIVFVFMYKFIRKYTGGFHCETALTCYLSSSTMCICVLLAIKYLPYNLGVYIVATVLSIGVLFAISPIEAINKPLEEIEVKVFGKRARIVLCITLVIFARGIRTRRLLICYIRISYLDCCIRKVISANAHKMAGTNINWPFARVIIAGPLCSLNGTCM